MATKLLDVNLLSYFTPSSQEISNPFSNASDFRSSLIWKPKGIFEITEKNRFFYFNDGTNKTATIDTGNYLASALATKIQTALNAVSSGFSVSYTANKFVISRSSSFIINFSNQTNAIFKTLAMNQTEDTSLITTYSSDYKVLHSIDYFYRDFAFPKRLTSIVFFSPVGKSLEGMLFKIIANNLPDFVNPVFSKELIIKDNIAMAFFDETYRYWRVEFTSYSDVLPEFYYIYIGEDLSFKHSIAKGFDISIDDLGDVVKTKSGRVFYFENNKIKKISANFKILDKNEKNNFEILYERKRLGKELIIVPDDTLTCSSDVLSVFFAEAPKFEHISRDLYSCNVNFSEAL